MLVNSRENVWMVILLSALRGSGVPLSTYLLCQSDFEIKTKKKKNVDIDQRRSISVFGKSREKIRSFLKIRG